MRKTSLISFGPGAASLILIVVILSMSVLGMLSLMSARADLNLTERSARVIEAVYELNTRAERRLASLDGIAVICGGRAQDDEDYLRLIGENLPIDMSMSEREISWTESDGLRELSCSVKVLPLNSGRRLEWTKHTLTAVTEEIWY